MNTYRSRVFALAAVVSLLLPACSGMTSSTVPQTGATRGTSSLPTKKLTDTYKPFMVVPGGTAAAALGVKKWGYYAWTDKKTTSVAGLSSTGDIVWEIDVTADSNAGTESVISSGGTNFAQTQRNGPIYVYGRGANDPQYVQALKTDTSAFTGYTGEGGGRPGGGGPLPASTIRQTRSQSDVYIAGAAFSWDSGRRDRHRLRSRSRRCTGRRLDRARPRRRGAGRRGLQHQSGKHAAAGAGPGLRRSGDTDHHAIPGRRELRRIGNGDAGVRAVTTSAT